MGANNFFLKDGFSAYFYSVVANYVLNILRKSSMSFFPC